MALTESEISKLKEWARKIRETTIEMLTEAGSGHTAGSLDMADMFAAFYFHILQHKPTQPEWAERDRLVLSAGHVCPALYATLAYAGYFPREECHTLRQFGSRLQGHPERWRLPGIETTSGPLGEGLGQAAGMALALKNVGSHVYCVMSDGEQDEGSVWEAALFASKNKLTNLIAVIDRNGIQLSGPTKDVMPLEPLAEKYHFFGWRVLECDGNDIVSFITTVAEARREQQWPTVIIAHTVAGKGVPEIEGDYRWHGRVPTHEEAARFLAALRAT